MATGDTITTDVLRNRLDPWLNNVPDYYDMIMMYKRLGELKAREIRLQRDITKVEEAALEDMDKPRSNEAKKLKIKASTLLRDDLANIQADLALIESDIKALEFKKVMFNAANYRARLAMDYA